VYTQTTDVEGELNGLLTYDRRIVRMNVDAWKSDIGDILEAAGVNGRVPDPKGGYGKKEKKRSVRTMVGSEEWFTGGAV
jgi:hypothetical protein